LEKREIVNGVFTRIENCGSSFSGLQRARLFHDDYISIYLPLVVRCEHTHARTQQAQSSSSCASDSAKSRSVSQHPFSYHRPSVFIGDNNWRRKMPARCAAALSAQFHRALITAVARAASL